MYDQKEAGPLISYLGYFLESDARKIVGGVDVRVVSSTRDPAAKYSGAEVGDTTNGTNS
jgi:hypothetical protein